MNKKGFTLVELIAAIGILMMLSTILIPVVVKRVNESKDKAYTTMINSIELSAKEYVLNNKDLSDFRNNDWVDISLEMLIKEKYFENNLIDPRTKELLPINNVVYVTRLHNGNIEANYDEFQNENPKIRLNGSFNIYLKKGKEYVDKGVEITTIEGEDVSNNVSIIGGVDTNNEGIYEITYSYQNVSIKRNVIVFEGVTIPAKVNNTITINPNGGLYNGSSEIIVQKVNKNSTITLKEPTKDGYVFKGWTVEGATITENRVNITTGSVIVTANWKKLISFTIDGTTYQAEEGMKFGEWLGSKYDTDNLIQMNNVTIDGTMLSGAGAPLLYSETQESVYYEDTINEGVILQAYLGGFP